MLKLNSIYSFSTLAPMVLGSQFSNVRLASILDYESANRLTNISEIHAMVYPVIKAANVSIDNDPTKYTYYKFQVNEDNSLIIAHEWIEDDTIKLEEKSTAVITLPNVTAEELKLVKSAFDRLGIIDYTLALHT